tara:strand:+ start:697 stop:930 length:234 start_codon:yes stop_codon:yes gene_type:complete
MSTGCEIAGTVQKEKTPARMMGQYVLGLCEVILLLLDFLLICAVKMAASQKTPINSQMPEKFMCNTSLCRCTVTACR